MTSRCLPIGSTMSWPRVTPEPTVSLPTSCLRDRMNPRFAVEPNGCQVGHGHQAFRSIRRQSGCLGLEFTPARHERQSVSTVTFESWAFPTGRPVPLTRRCGTTLAARRIVG